MRAGGIDTAHLLAVSLAMGVVGVALFHLTIGRRLGRQFRDRRRKLAPLTPLERLGVAVGLLLSLTGLGILLLVQPEAPSVLFYAAQLLIKVPCIGYAAFANSRYRRS